jgi:hypothetical protein
MNQLSPANRSRLLPLLALLISLTAGCSFQPLNMLNLPDQSAPPAPTLTEVTFKVQIPPNTPLEETIYVSTLDEVTGLGVNAQAHQMDPVMGESNLEDGLVYQTTLTVPLHTTLKYRYTRTNQYAVIEHTETHRQVRYRMLHVDGPKTVSDVVFQWSDTEYNGDPPGRISGTITDQETGEPLPGVLVTAGGVQTLTAANGTYQLSGLPPGVHNLVAYALDGSYGINQQGAQVASQANTQADLALPPRDFVDVTFVVTVPAGTPEESVRLAGNLYQLGNTFGNLTGGMNTIPDRMPRLTSIGLNQYGVILSLPAGAEIRYKYTMGDGFWNAEHDESGAFEIRRMIVPDQAAQINDQVATWMDGSQGPITFDLSTPAFTPANEDIYIQFNPYGWTAPLPMMKIEDHHWAYILYSPLEIISDLTYRYCRESECGTADDQQTAGANPAGRNVSAAAQSTYLADTVESWAWFDPHLSADLKLPAEISPRSPDFQTGFELMPGNRPAHASQVQEILPVIAGLHADTAVLSPTWTWTHQAPPVLEPDPSRDQSWYDLRDNLRAAGDENLRVSLFPKPHFPGTAGSWWQAAPRDFSWWNSWFDQYHQYAVHFAETAQAQGAETLVLGGSWLAPALPKGKLADGSPSGVPADADLRWADLLEDIKTRYQGEIAWAMPYPKGDAPPDFLELVDAVYLDWSPPLSESAGYTFEELNTAAVRQVTQGLNDFYQGWLAPDEIRLVVMVSYPSVEGGLTQCLSGSEEAEAADQPDCLDPASLSFPAPHLDGQLADFQAQADAYAAVLSALDKQEWVSGVISRGYYAPAVLHDGSISVHGKPAAEVISAWYAGWRP